MGGRADFGARLLWGSLAIRTKAWEATDCCMVVTARHADRLPRRHRRVGGCDELRSLPAPEGCKFASAQRRVPRPRCGRHGAHANEGIRAVEGADGGLRRAAIASDVTPCNGATRAHD